MKNLVNAKLGGNPTSHAETNLALLSSIMKEQKGFTQSLSSMLKKSGFNDMYNMLVDNAGSFYTLHKKYPNLEINDLLQDSIMILGRVGSDTKQGFKEIADELEFYINSKNKDVILKQRQDFGITTNPIQDFQKEILGLTLKRYTMNNTNPSEHLFNKIKDFEHIARDIRNGSMFESGRDIERSDFITHLYSNVADTRSDIGFLLKVANNYERIEKGNITLDSIKEDRVREYIKRLQDKGALKSPEEYFKEGQRLRQEANNKAVNESGIESNKANTTQSLKEASQAPLSLRGVSEAKDEAIHNPNAQTQGESTLPTKTTLEKDLTTQEIKEVVDTWDLTNPKKSDKLIVSRVKDDELEQLSKDFNFKGNYALAREIDAEHVAHALNRHSDDANSANIPLTKDEIFNMYPDITKPNNHDYRVVTNNNTIIYSKQINGHFIAIEEVLSGRNKLRFDTAWKQKGKLNKEVLFKNAKAFPNTAEPHKVASDERSLDQILGGTSHNQSLIEQNHTTKPQTTQDIIKEAKASGKSVKETKQLIAENNAQKEASIFDDKSLSSTNTKQETKEAHKPFAPKDRISEYDTNLKNFLQDNHEITTITKSKKIQRGYKWVNQEVKEPRKFYHYTKESKLSEFDKEKDSSGLGFWFVSEPDNATPFAKELDKENKVMFGNSKKEVYLSIKNPFLDGVPISTTQITSQKEALKDLFKDNKKALGFIDSNPQSSVEKLLEHLEYSRGQSRAKEFKDLLESKGYDKRSGEKGAKGDSKRFVRI